MLTPDGDFWQQVAAYTLSEIGEGVHVVDRYGITLAYNEALGKMEDLRPKDVIGRNFLEVYPSLTVETSLFLEVMRTGEPINKRIQSYTTINGKEVSVLVSIYPIIIRGERVGAIEISRSILKESGVTRQEIGPLTGSKQVKGVKPKGQTARYTFSSIITRNEKMKELLAKAQRAALTDSPVLVYGRTGTGKEMLVQAIHNASPRSAGPFVAQNCAAIPENLLEGLLFGTVRGAFTGSYDRAGVLELANGGTFYLDELTSMSPTLQAKLLRVLEEGYAQRIGDVRRYPINVRFVASLNVSPTEAVRQGLIREDLYYRLGVVQLELPPLCERRDDIPLLVEHFLDQCNEKIRFRRVKRVSDEVMDLFMNYDWPGNVRELAHVIEGATVVAEKDCIEIWNLPPYMRTLHSSSAVAVAFRREEGSHDRLRGAMQQYERQLISRVLNESGGNISKAARILGIPRQTMWAKVKRLGIRQHV
ncbi:MAG TPA: sigma 54-interacting transcriptional regulator [Clostridia bacterium]|nr:sigma 54-interacting transcriptional regulator [Clostridia bacterium]